MKSTRYLLLALLFVASLNGNQWANNTSDDGHGNPLPFNFKCSSPCVPNCWCDWMGTNGFFSKLMVWNMYSDGLDWATRVISTTTTTTNIDIVFDNDVYKHEFNYRPGFQLGFSHLSPSSNSDLTLLWTYYWNSDSQFQTTTDLVHNQLYSPYLSPIPLAFAPLASEETISSKMTFRINRVDMTIGQYVEACDGFLLNFYAGIVSWGTNENLFVQSAYITSTNPLFFTTSQQINTLYRGSGAEVGLKLNWNFWNCFILSANSTIAGTVGKYKLNSNNNVSSQLPIGVDIIKNFSAPISYWTGRVAASLGFALEYSYCLCRNWTIFSSLGWEYHKYFDQTSFQVKPTTSILVTQPNETYTRAPANLVLQGVTFTIGTTF